MSKKKIIMILAGGLLAVVLIAGALAYPSLKKRWQAPLGPSLDLPTYTPTVRPPEATDTPASLAAATRLPQETGSPVATRVEANPTATREPSPTPKPLCGGPPVMTVLGLGIDTEDESYTYGLADAIRVARVDFVTPKITVLSIPRDLWVEIPGISDHYDITHGKLNQAFLYGGPGMGYYDGPGEGPGLMARTLDLNFNLRVDHYGAVNMWTFAKIVDAVGGIDLYLPTDVDGTPTNPHTDDMGYFYAGNNHFTGDEALRFSRIRKRYNDFTRMDHQNMVLCALRDKLLTPSVLPKIPQIIDSFQGSVKTDLSLEQMSQLACLLPYIESENLVFGSLPDEIMSPSRVFSPQMEDTTFVMEVDYDVIRDYFSRFMAGTWPEKSSDSSSGCP